MTSFTAGVAFSQEGLVRSSSVSRSVRQRMLSLINEHEGRRAVYSVYLTGRINGCSVKDGQLGNSVMRYRFLLLVLRIQCDFCEVTLRKMAEGVDPSLFWQVSVWPEHVRVEYQRW